MGISVRKMLWRCWGILLLIAAVLGSGEGCAQESLPSPAITAIRPAPVIGEQKRQWLKIEGSGFTPASKVTLRLGDQVFPIPDERTKYISNTELEVFVNVSTGPSTWTVEVDNPAGGNSEPFSFEVIPPSSIQNKAEWEEQRRALEVEGLERKAEDAKEEIKRAATAAEEAKQEAEKAATRRASIQQEIKEKEQAARAAKQRLEAATAGDQVNGNWSVREESEKLAQEAEQLEEAAAAAREKLAVLDAREQQAQKIASAAESEIQQLRKEFIELRRQRAEKRTFLEKMITVSGIILVGCVIWLLKRFAVRKFESATAKKETVRAGSERLHTVVSLLNWLGTIIIVLIASYLVLDEFGINMGPVLAGAGIIGLALGFGGQYLIRDIINGIFILVEGQFNINDIVQIGEFSGIVEGVNLRHTKLRDLEGRVIYIPNGEIKTVVNFTKDYGRVVIDVGVAYKENVDRVMEIMQEVTEEMRREPRYGKLIKDFEIFGVEKFGESEVTLRCRFKTQKAKQWEVAREYRRRIKNRFDELNIEIPFPHRTLYWGDSPQEERNFA